MMRIHRGMMAVSIGMFVALALTHQQITLIEASYAVEQRVQLKADMLDQYHILLYNVLTLQAPQLLEQRLARRDITLVSPRRIAWMAPPITSSFLIADTRGAPGFLVRGRRWVARVLTPHATAEAVPGP